MASLNPHHGGKTTQPPKRIPGRNDTSRRWEEEQPETEPRGSRDRRRRASLASRWADDTAAESAPPARATAAATAPHRIRGRRLGTAGGHEEHWRGEGRGNRVPP